MAYKKLSFKARIASRKFVIMISILSISTILLIAPVILNAILVMQFAPILTGGEWASTVIGCFGLYVGANVMEKKVSLATDEAPDV